MLIMKKILVASLLLVTITVQSQMPGTRSTFNVIENASDSTDVIWENTIVQIDESKKSIIWTRSSGDQLRLQIFDSEEIEHEKHGLIRVFKTIDENSDFVTVKVYHIFSPILIFFDNGTTILLRNINK